jgi:UPF0716 protein FxsA
MLLRILLVLLAIQLMDLIALVWLSHSIGFWQTLGLIIAVGMLGGYLARREGSRVWRGWSNAVQTRGAPTAGIMDGMLILIGGALLVAPGILTDILGVVLLIPITRRPLARLISRRMQVEFERRAQGRARIIGGFPEEGVGRVAWEEQPSSSPKVIDTTGVESRQ